MRPANVTLEPVTEPDFPVLRQLATAIWRQHYATIIPLAQIDYMLGGRLGDDALHAQVGAADTWLEMLRSDGTPVGYCSAALTADGGDGTPAIKLGQLYVLDTHRGMGLGRLMLGHVERRARDLGRGVLWLQVNKRNSGAIDFYEAAGFVRVREAVFDIGAGFVMDDYVMAKRL